MVVVVLEQILEDGRDIVRETGHVAAAPARRPGLLTQRQLEVGGRQSQQ